MKEIAKVYVLANSKRKTGNRMMFGLGLIGATGIATTLLLSSKIQKISVSTTYKDIKKAVVSMAEKPAEVKKILTHGYKNIHRDLHKVAIKLTKEFE